MNPESEQDLAQAEVLDKLQTFFDKRSKADESQGIDLNFNLTRVPGVQAKGKTEDIYMLLVSETIGDLVEDLVIVLSSESMAYNCMAHALLVRAQMSFDKSHGARWNMEKNSLAEASTLGCAACVDGSAVGPGFDAPIETAQGTKTIGELVRSVVRKENA